MEHRQFEQTGKPHEDDTPGALKFGGYLWRDVRVKTRYYRALGRKIGGAQVEIVDHAREYPYVTRDFFGTYRKIGAGNRRPPRDIGVVDGIVNEDGWTWRFLDWANDAKAVTDKLCVAMIRKGDGIYGGTVGWYSRGDDGIKTVFIGYDQVDGVPVQLIDEYLKKYPSSVKESDFHGATWVSDDIQKWIHLLQLHKSDKMMFGMALGHLAAYDINLFGVNPKRLDTDDNAVFEKAIRDVKLGAERWLQNRATENRKRKDE